MASSPKSANRIERREKVFELPDGTPLRMHDKAIGKMDIELLRYVYGFEEANNVRAYLKKKTDNNVGGVPHMRNVGKAQVTVYDPDAPWKLTLRPGYDSPLCQQCALCNADTPPATPFFKPVGPANPLITIITDGITVEEDKKGVLGAAGTMSAIKRMLVIMAEQGDVDINSIRWVPITRCAARGKAANLKIKGNWCRYHVIDDILKHRPKLIITVGTQVTGLFSHKSSVQDWAGRTLTYRGWPDDWLTNRLYALPRPHPADPTGERKTLGHPLFGQQPDLRIPLIPVQSPHMVFWDQNPITLKRFISHIKGAVKTAQTGWTPPELIRPWYRFTEDVEEIRAGLAEILRHPGILLAFDTETTGLRGWAADAGIVSMMFRWVDPETNEPRSLGFPFEFKENMDRPPVPNAVFPYVKSLWPLIWKALCQSTLVGHNLTFDVLYTFSRRWCDTLGKFGDSALNRQRDRLLCNLVDAAKYDTWHEAYVFRQQRERLGLEHMTYRFVPDLAGYEEDMTMLISLCPEELDPSTRAKGSEGHYLRCPRDKWESHLIPYVMGDVEVTYRTHEEIQKRLASADVYSIPLARPGAPGAFRLFTTPGRKFVYDKIMSPASQVLTKIMARGMFVDVEKRKKVTEELDRKITETAQKFLVGCKKHIDEQQLIEALKEKSEIKSLMELDLDSKTHLHTLFFHEHCLDLPVYRLTKKGRKLFGETQDEWHSKLRSEIIEKQPRIGQKELSREVHRRLLPYAAIDKFTLNQLAVKHEHVRSLLEYRKLFKLNTAYVHPLLPDDLRPKGKPGHLMFDQCVHASFLLTGTRGGRLCVAGDTKLEVCINGIKKLVAISDLWMYNGQHVTVKTHKGRWRRIVRLYFKGHESMYRVVTENGSSIQATAGHEVYTDRGWKSLSDAAGQKLKLLINCESCGVGSGRAKFQALGDRKTHEFSTNQRIDIAACGSAKLEGVSTLEDQTSRVALGSSGRCSEGQRKWSASTISAFVERPIGTARSFRHTHGTDCQGDGNHAVFSRTEYPDVWVAEIGQCAGPNKNFDGISVETDRDSVSGVDGCFCTLFCGQGAIFQKSLQSVYNAFAASVVFEGYVPNAFYATQRGQRRNGRNIVVNEPARIGTFSGVDIVENSALSRVRLQRQSSSRLRADWNEYFDRGRRGVPHGSREQSQHGYCCGPRLPSAALYDKASSVQDGCDNDGNSGCFESIIHWCSVGVQAVWDIEVEEDHSYLAQGLFHHNSCRDPNLQQLPRDGVVKELYTSRFGKRGCLYQADLSQIELRLMAAACGDPTMVKAYFDDTDLHSLTASRIFDTPYDHFTKEHMKWLQSKGKDEEAKLLDLNRTTAKTVNFLTGYGGGAFGLQNVLAMKGIFKEIEECQEIIELFFNSYSALRSMLQFYKRFILDNLCAVSIFGRVRFFEEAQSEDGEQQSKALRAGTNHLIQSTASDMLLIALSVIEQMMREEDLESILVSTVHDSLVIDAIREELPQVHEIVDTVLNNFPSVFKTVFGDNYDDSWMLVPFTGDAEIGKDYYHLKKVGKKPDWDKLLSDEDHTSHTG